VLAVEFEEFFPLDRAYLDALAEDCDLICIAKENESVRHMWVEIRPVTDYISFGESRRGASGAPSMRPTDTVAYFTDDTVPGRPGNEVGVHSRYRVQ